jgi:hypothetical protein
MLLTMAWHGLVCPCLDFCTCDDFALSTPEKVVQSMSAAQYGSEMSLDVSTERNSYAPPWWHPRQCLKRRQCTEPCIAWAFMVRMRGNLDL